MYPHYKHHREPSAVKEGLWWWRNLFRKTKYYLQEKNLLENLIAQHSQKYYFVPLQTYNDFQLLEHSSYASIEIFIEEVLDSFASFAPKDSILVFKHHPADRGRKNYKNFIQNLAKEKGIEEKVLVIYDLHLPTLLENARATITINSTVGLSSLAHQTPTLTLGDAIYDIEGITSKGMPLDKFWTDFKKPNKKLFNKFRNYLIKTTQLNGSFYGNFPLEFESDEMYL